MESSDAETGMVDCAVGTIVWVRRRNGSWWPGKILGPDELSASHLMSPRSGTPVKLLGREDASVDWYNLEKSKRVKPFRCGEFDDCIERAEASQGMPPKKREKYARREDAILHALELEKQVLEKKYGKSGVRSNGLSTKLLGKDTNITPELSRDNVDPSVDDKRIITLQSRRGADSLNIDDNSPAPDVHHPSLQDHLGAGPIPFKHKLSVSHRLHAAENMVTVGSKKLLEKRKRRSQEKNMEEESVGKRRDRHRPLVQVLQSSAKLPHTPHPSLQSKADEVVHPDPAANDPGMAAGSFDHTETLPDQLEISAAKSFPVVALSEDNTTGSNEDTETDSSGTESLISDTNDAMAALSGEEDMEFIPKAFGRCEGEGGDSDDELGVTNESGTVSKWQLKGKRNSRSLRKRKVPMSCSHWMMGFNFKGEDTESNQMIGFGGYNNNNNNNNSSSYMYRGGGGLDMSWDDWDVNRGMLIDVEVGVQSGYQREHVPMISLMSKLNDKAIVGHPIPIEALQDGSSEIILSDFHMEVVPTPTTTTRRTTAKCRVSRPPPHLSTLEEEVEEDDDDDDDDDKEEEEEEYYYYYNDEDGKRSAGSFKGRKKPQRRSSASCSSSQKIRTLSSIGGSHHHQKQKQKQVQMQSMDIEEAGEGMMMMMKPESLPTAVACIPVKLVFSRLHEELLVAHRHQ